METSAEIRWFWDAEPTEIRAWFADARRHGCDAGGGGERTDQYLIDPKQDELGVKVRGGAGLGVDVKGLVDVRRGSLTTGPFAGPVEIWTKWRSALDIEPGKRRAVVKVRRLRKFACAGARIAEIPLGADEKPAAAGAALPALGCNVELTSASVDGRTAWTLGLEAFGPLSTVEESLRATAAELARRDPPALRAARLASYPAWLRDRGP